MIKHEDVERILDACVIEEVVGDFVRLQKRGGNYIGLCPFHNEKTPSFNVNPERGIFKCFGCGVGGNAVHFIMKHENYSYLEALRYLAQKYSIEIQEITKPAEVESEYNEREELFSILEFAKKYFIEQLFNSEEGTNIGLTYFESRDFSSETIKKFQLGYCSKEKDNFTKYALQNGYSIDILNKSGLTIVKDNNIYSDRFRERVIFPIHNFSGKVIGFGGRVMSVGKPEHIAKYINSPETAVYHKSETLYGIFLSKNAIRKNDKCYLVEGYTDVISFHQVGIENVVASSGTSLTQGQIKFIKKLTNNITVIYDGDNAGIKASLRSISLILKEDMNIRIVLLPPEDDPDSFARKRKLNDCLEYIHEHEQNFIEFKANLLLQDVKNDPIKKAEVINEIAKDIALVNDIMLRSLFIQQCGALLNVPEESLVQAINKERRKLVSKQNKENNHNSENQENEFDVIKTSSNNHPQELLDSVHNYLELAEKDLLKLLINKGENIVYVTSADSEDLVATRVDQYIVDNLTEDNIVFSNPDFQELYSIYQDFAEEYNTNIVQHLLSLDNENLRNLITQLQEFRISPSKHWEDAKINSPIKTIDNNEVTLLEEVIRKLQSLKLEHLQIIREKYFCKLKTAEDADIENILHNINVLNKTISEIESVTGTPYRKKI